MRVAWRTVYTWALLCAKGEGWPTHSLGRTHTQLGEDTHTARGDTHTARGGHTQLGEGTHTARGGHTQLGEGTHTARGGHAHS